MDRLNYVCTYAYVYGTGALESAKAKLKEKADRIKNDESGMEIIAVILILAIVLAIGIIFKDQITSIADKIFGEIKNDANNISDDGNLQGIDDYKVYP